jgi:hypothetical protein
VGNALFIATSLAVIVASASGGFAGAIVLYETALGVGILLHAADHGAAGRMVAEYANTVGASTIVVGRATHRGLPALMDDSATHELSRLARSDIMIVGPDAPGRLIAADGYDTVAQAG